jgi:ribosomal protein S18 acetylase RimI-like enzyme
MVAVSEVTDPNDPVLADLNALLPQLSSSAQPVTPTEFEQMVRSDASRLLIARGDDEELLGSMTLVLFRIPTGVRAWIEDVVVDEAARGLGVGEQLNSAAIDLAYSTGARTIDLTSRPSRVAANNLYKKLGFEERDTNIYRHNPEADTVTRDA